MGITRKKMWTLKNLYPKGGIIANNNNVNCCKTLKEGGERKGGGPSRSQFLPTGNDGSQMLRGLPERGAIQLCSSQSTVCLEELPPYTHLEAGNLAFRTTSSFNATLILSVCR